MEAMISFDLDLELRHKMFSNKYFSCCIYIFHRHTGELHVGVQYSQGLTGQ